MKKIILLSLLGISSSTAFSQEVSNARNSTVTEQSGANTSVEKKTNNPTVLNSTSKTGKSVEVKQPESKGTTENSGEKKSVETSSKRQQD